MRDLELWRQLRAGTATPAALDAVAAWPLGRRAAYLGWIAPLAAHDEPAMRVAALHALSGCRGVPGVRAIVAALDDDVAEVRAAAVAALRVTARDAPVRYAHALFHPRAETRRAALEDELPRAAAELGIYLRADPACADLAANAPWSDGALEGAFDLHEAGHVPARELVELVLQTPPATVRAFLQAQRHRAPHVIDAYLDHVVIRGAEPAAGHDPLDTLVAAIAGAAAEATFPLARVIDRFVELVTPRKARALTRRAAVAVLDRHARGAMPDAMRALAAVLEPRVIEMPGFGGSVVDAAIAAIVRYRWPV